VRVVLSKRRKGWMLNEKRKKRLSRSLGGKKVNQKKRLRNISQGGKKKKV